MMRRAIELAASVRATTPPNPWVGAVLLTPGGHVFEGATSPPGGPHAEVVALDAAQRAGADTWGSTLAVTLEPCCHHGRTPPCTDAILAAGVSRVVVGLADPDPRVDGGGLERLRQAGVEVRAGVLAPQVAVQLAPYLHHRRTGRPLVVLKLAATLDGRTAAADGTSQWITSEEARADAHQLRADSDAVLVGAGTVRADDPALTVRHVEGRDPLRVVLGTAPCNAKVHPCIELSGELPEVLAELGRRGVLQVLVEGGAMTAGAFHRAGLVDRYVLYLAPALMGGEGAAPLLGGPSAPTIADLWRGRIASADRVGPDLRIVLERQGATT